MMGDGDDDGIDKMVIMILMLMVKVMIVIMMIVIIIVVVIFYFSAGLAGAIHFDDDELFVLGEHEGAVDFYWLAVHEIGHTLGLQHSDVKEAAMFSMQKVFKELHADDIKGISMIYGMNIVLLLYGSTIRIVLMETLRSTTRQAHDAAFKTLKSNVNFSF